ncbi:MAG TPA: glycosyltransferase [Thermoanaerobaculia bacterium]|jgi:glycosyltransferase involved in cell wall biosynthesis|nr:glycosyltransferase [Thermoanaerobaculia bacterium]
MNSPLACTIIANNYLAYARAFTCSFLERHPEGKVCVLIVDHPQPGHRYEDEPFAVVFAGQLGIPGFPHLSFRYSILELSTAVKPWFLLHLHRTLGCDRVCYFDPDVLIFGDLGELYARLGRADAVLTPHLTAPIDDSLVPSEREILLSGIYNLGFLGLAFNERTLPFLDWWRQRLYRWCLHEVDKGLFVDQRWMDLAPAYLSRVEILRDPGYNVAYWNLVHRTLARREDAWWVGDSLLRFFHFSGYDFRRPETISKFQNRFTFAERPDVVPLFATYRESIRRQGQEEVQSYPYAYGRFDNGVAIPDLARRALRQVDPDAVRWPDPFATAGPDSFFDWLRQPVDGDASIPLPRLALLLWDEREDLRRFFSQPWAADRLGFAHWLIEGASGAERIDPVFTAGLAGALSRHAALPAHPMTRLASLVDPPELASGELEAGEIAWLTADAGHEPRRRPRVPRLALEMHRRRADLLRAFPDPLGADRAALALWYVTSGRHEYQLPKTVVLPVLRTLSWRRQAWARLWWERQRRRGKQAGAQRAAAERPAADAATAVTATVARAAGPTGFNVIGWSTAPTGVGEACRGTLAALENAGLGCALWPLDGRTDGAPGAVAAGTAQGLPYEVSLYHVNADMMETVQSRLPRGFTAGRHRIGYWFWELAHFPLSFAPAFRHVDEVWAPSRFCQQAFQSVATVEVRRVPPCVVPGTAAPASREALGIAAESFLFLFAFDALSVPERKNPAGLLAAFTRVARESRRPVHLLVKLNHAEAEPVFAAELQRRCAGLPVTLLTGTLRRDHLDGLTAACDAYVSLHRSEGLGLPLIEAMYRGKPVIATGYGGVTDFLDEETGFVVRHGLTTLERPLGPYPAGAVWAEPDAEHAAALMLALAAAPEAAAAKVAAARRRVLELYGPEAAGRRLRCELARIREGRHG